MLLLVLPGQFVKSDHFAVERQKEVLSAFVRITDRSPHNGGVGSGAIVGSDKESIYVLSAFHVVDPGERIEIECFGSEGYPQPGPTFRDGIVRVVHNRSADIALMRIQTDYRPAHEVQICGTKGPIRHERPVLTVGYSGGRQLSCVEDKIHGTTLRAKEEGWITFWVTNGVPVAGRSGGPLLNADGRLIGVCRGILAGNAQFPAEGLYSNLEQIHLLFSRAGMMKLVDSRPPATPALAQTATLADSGPTAGALTDSETAPRAFTASAPAAPTVAVSSLAASAATH